MRWLLRETPYVLNNGLPDLIWTRERRHQQSAAGDTHIFSPAIVNNFRLATRRTTSLTEKRKPARHPPAGSEVLSTIGLQGANPDKLSGQGFPEVDISGLTSLSDLSGGVKDNSHILTVNDVIDWQIGSHSLKFGGSVEHYGNFYGVVPNYGTFTFDGSITGNADADFLLGLPQEMKCVIVYRQIDAGIRYGEIVALGKRQRLS